MANGRAKEEIPWRQVLKKKKEKKREASNSGDSLTLCSNLFLTLTITVSFPKEATPTGKKKREDTERE